MADDSAKIWIDASFFHSEELVRDTNVEIRPSANDNVGNYTIPVVISNILPQHDKYSIPVYYFQESSTTSGYYNVPGEYYSYIVSTVSGYNFVNVEYNSSIGSLNYYDIDTKVLYETAYYTVSGSQSKVVNAVIGLGIYGVGVTPVGVVVSDEVVVSLDYWSNYTNYCGDHSIIDGSPIPTRSGEIDITSEYGYDFYGYVSGTNWIQVDVFFASWIPTPIELDVYSSIEAHRFGYETEITVSGGGKLPHYLDIISSDQGINFIRSDVYCALTDYYTVDTEISTISGTIGYNTLEIFSCEKENLYLTADIMLYSVKISNFSIEVGEYTLASGIISVDLIDDICPIDKSKSYLLVDDIEVPVTFSGISDGYRMFYDPEDDFKSIVGPTTFTVHAENECGDYLDEFFYLTYGYIVEYNNIEDEPGSIDFEFGKKVAVRVTAENNASCPQSSTLAWDFSSREKHNSDLQASITGRFHSLDTEELSAKIYPNSSAYFYGKTMRIVVEAKDFAGNKMEPFVLVYKIENKPVN